MDPADTVRTYYAAIDGGDYDRLDDLLVPDFVQHRPDRTFVGREAFVNFMRDERPRTETEHAVDALYRRTSGEGGEGVGVVARGRVLADDGAELFAFADAFEVVDGRLRSLHTYTA
ncbi:MAG: nuclear transport factor 2 family protein [Halobacteriaceae archaeon]